MKQTKTKKNAGGAKLRLLWLAGFASLLVGGTAPAVAAAPGPAAPEPPATPPPVAQGPAYPSPGHMIVPGTRLFVPPPDQGAIQQELSLLRSGQVAEARLIAEMEAVPKAVWLTGGTPQQVEQQVREVMFEAQVQRAEPVLVAYNIPGRDCSQYSAGGASSEAAYEAWIDAVAAGIGNHPAIVLLEPDSLGLLPSTCSGAKSPFPTYEPNPDTNPDTNPADLQRFAELNYAVNALEADPNTVVYLDGTHSAWLSVGAIAQELVDAGVERAQGFFLNVSNYQPTPELIDYGTWISDCIAFAHDSEQGGWRLGHYDYCASQYYPATQNNFVPWQQNFATWGLSSQWYQQNMGTAQPTTHFVIDTSRNGQGPNDMSLYASPPYNQPQSVIDTLVAGNWCNPPGAGLGIRPTTNTGVALLDAYLWVKIPGESDGSCDAAGGARAWDYQAYTQPGWPTTPSQQALFDPLWGLYDPPAGSWFPEQALQLAENANPPLPSFPLIPAEGNH
jgi:endoglucanase